MPEYRLYYIDGTGRFHGIEVVQADSDEHAIELSNEALAGSSGELWLAGRMVRPLGEGGAKRQKKVGRKV